MEERRVEGEKGGGRKERGDQEPQLISIAKWGLRCHKSEM